MPGFLKVAGLAACAAFVGILPAAANDDAGIRDVLLQTTAAVQTAGQKPAPAVETAANTQPGGGLEKQTDHVVTSCFPASLRAVLDDISGHFGGKPVIVTSGHRHGGRRGSFHRKCMAADIQIDGVSPSAIARYARSLPSVGGVGTYGHTRSIHVDVGGRVYSWYGNGRRKRYAQTHHGHAGRAS